MYRVGRLAPCHLRWVLRHYSSMVTAEPFLNGSTANYVEAMYEIWQKDPSGVHKVGLDVCMMQCVCFGLQYLCLSSCRPAVRVTGQHEVKSPSDCTPPFLQSWDAFFRNASSGSPPGHAYTSPPSLRPFSGPSSQVLRDSDVIRDHLRVQALIRAYQIRGQNIGTGVVTLTLTLVCIGTVGMCVGHY